MDIKLRLGLGAIYILYNYSGTSDTSGPATLSAVERLSSSGRWLILHFILALLVASCIASVTSSQKFLMGSNPWCVNVGKVMGSIVWC